MPKKFNKFSPWDYYRFMFEKPGLEKKNLLGKILWFVVYFILLGYYFESFVKEGFSIKEPVTFIATLGVILYTYKIYHIIKEVIGKYFSSAFYNKHKRVMDKEVFKKIILSQEDYQAGWRIYDFTPHRNNAIAVYSGELNRHLREHIGQYKLNINDVKLTSVHRVIKQNWNDLKLFLHYYYMRSRILGKNFSNDKKVCLGSDINKTGNTLDVYFGKYYDSVLTNEACGTRIIDNTTGDTVTHIGVSLFTDKDKLLSLSSSLCNNHIGVSTLGITRDNKIVLWTQNERTLQNSNLMVPTASGSLDAKDFYTATEKTLEAVIINGINRELTEENDLDGKLIIRTKVIGFWKYLERGAKPEFSCITYLDCDADILKASAEEQRTHPDFKSILDINSKTFKNDAYLLIKQDKCSLPLQMCITCYLESLGD